MCHVTKHSTVLGVFQQPWPGVSPILQFERGEGPGDEVDTAIFSSFLPMTPRNPSTESNLLSLPPRLINSDWVRVCCPDTDGIQSLFL